MSKYSNLDALKVTAESLAEYVFDDIPGEPSIWFAPATDANLPFFNERARLNAERAERMAALPRGRSINVTPEQVEEERDTDRRLLAQTCAKKWGTAPIDADGKTNDFSPEECYDFFAALPDYMFDPMRNFVVNPRNFVDRSKLKRPIHTAKLGE